MKLLSTTEYVLWLRSMTLTELCKELPQQFKEPVWTGDQDQMVKDFLAHDAIKWRLAGDYAKLLIRPLKLGMFVPCNSKGKVLHYPMMMDYLKYTEDQETKYPQECYAPDLEEFQKAEERVLFKNFLILHSEIRGETSRKYLGYKGSRQNFANLPEFSFNFPRGAKTIEDLLPIKDFLEINESAIYHWTYVD